MTDLAGWIAPAATMIAAIMTAANLGTRVTGWGFGVFTIGAIAWIVVAIGSGQHNLLFSNAFLLVVDVVGMWRWLGRRARHEAGAEAAVTASRDAPAADLFALSTLPGAPVHDAEGKVIAGTVDALAACGSGAIAFVVITRGGIGGVGETLHAIGWDEVVFADGTVRTRLDDAALGRRRALDPQCWPESAEAAGVG